MSRQWGCLNDGGVLNAALTPGPFEVWYAKPEFFHQPALVQSASADLSLTHVKVGSVMAQPVESIYHTMQGEVWSPEGEARQLITKLGLQHTSMSVGDVIRIPVKKGYKVLVVDRIGFKTFLPEGS